MEDLMTAEGNRISEERDRISRALLDPATSADQYKQLYAAQQALSWAFEDMRSPYDMIMLGPVTEAGPNWGTLPSSGDCSAQHGQASS
jgi:hypothetical protein